ncbi:MAG: 4Fe-4S binding protein [Planctomycetota bacterium]|jgi:dihydroorotate dehydrogenase/NAD-dependent dihydropyrimidine dehydrogenase PreA subunit
MRDLSVQIGNLQLQRPVFLAAGPLTTKMENLEKAESLGLAAVDTKAAISTKYPHTKCYERTCWDHDTKVLNWMLGPWRGEFLYIEDAVRFISRAKQLLSIPVFGNFKGDSSQSEQWVLLATQLEEAGADALVTFFTFVRGFAGNEIQMIEKIMSRVCSAVNIPVILKLQPETCLAVDTFEIVNAVENAGLAAIQISDGIAGYPGLSINKPPYHPFACIEFQARDAFISGPYLKPLIYKIVNEYYRVTRLPIICSGGIWDGKSAIEAILYGASVVASSSGPCIKGWNIFTDIIQSIENYMAENNYSSINDFRGLADQYIKNNDQIDFPDCYAVVDEDKCTGCEECLLPAHCDAIEMHNDLAKVNKEFCIGCCICSYLCPVEAIEIKIA